MFATGDTRHFNEQLDSRQVLFCSGHTITLAALNQLVIHPLAALGVVALVEAFVERLQLELAVPGDVRGRLLH